MIKEIIFASILQAGDIASTKAALQNKHNYEANWLMQGNRIYATSAVSTIGAAYGINSIKNKKARIIVAGVWAGVKIGIIANNLKKR